MIDRSTIRTTLIVNLVLAALYFLAARLGLRLASLHGNVSPVWPASGFAIAAVTIGGRRVVPSILAGAFLANAFTPISIVAAAAIAIGNTLEAVGGAALIHWSKKRGGSSARRSGVLAYLGAATLAPVLSATVGVSTLSLAAAVPASALGRLWLTWWAGDGLGALVLAPALITAYAARSEWRRPRPSRIFQAFAVCAVASVVCAWVFLGTAGSPMLFLVFPVLLLATAWFGALGVKWTTVGIVSFSVLAAASGRGPFVTDNLNDSLLYLEVFLAALALTALMLSLFHQSGDLALPAVVLMVGWALSGWLFASLQRERVRLDDFRTDQLIDDVEQAMQQRLTIYIDALRSAASLYDASEKVERDEWRRFVESLDLVTRYPGVDGMGVVLPVRGDEVGAFLQQVRADSPDFAIHTVLGEPAPTAEHWVVTYIEPGGLNRAALGVDIATENNRRAAALIARDTGTPQITARIALVQDGEKRTGFLLFVPMYQPILPRDTVEQRRSHFRGWVYAPFVTGNFLSGVLGNREGELELHLFEGDSVDVSRQLYATGNPGPPIAPKTFGRVRHIELAGQRFTLGWNRGRGFVASSRAAEVSAGSSLALVSALLAGLVMSLQTTGRRAHELADERTGELQEANRRLQEQIGERERAEEEAQRARRGAEVANAAKSDFLATMSHEIRTPLNTVSGYTTLLLDSPLSETQKEWARSIAISGRALLDIISDILDFSQIEAGKLQLERIPFHPSGTLGEVITLMMQPAAEKNLLLTFDEEPAVPEWVIGDPARIRQILMNLVSNAIKFTDTGSVRTTVKWEPADATRGMLHVSVVDTGIGIEQDKQDRLFQKFSQAKSSTKRQYGGTGLGLAICKQLVELMGGTVRMKSERGVGSTFSFDLPLACTTVPEHEGSSARHQLPKLGRPCRVLVADDVAVNQLLAATILRKLGCEVQVASNGREAVMRAREETYDLVLMDCQMPELDGFGATRELRSYEATTRANLPPGSPFRPLRIIALTANAVQGDREACLQAGMDDYISKPFQPGDFARVIERWAKA